MSLASIQRTKRNGPRRVVIYGVHKIGKSTFGANAPAPVFVPTEDGTDSIDCEAFPLATTYDEFMGNLTTLATEEHEYKTCVIDSADWLERLIWAKVIEDRPRTEKGAMVNDIEDYGFGKGFKHAIPYWTEVLRALNHLRLKQGMWIVMILHSKVEKFADPRTEAYDRYSPKLQKDASALVQEWADDILFANYRTFTRTEDAGFNRERTIAAGNGERVIFTTERPAHIAGNRCGLPDELALDWRAYADHAIKTEDQQEW